MTNEAVITAAIEKANRADDRDVFVQIREVSPETMAEPVECLIYELADDRPFNKLSPFQLLTLEARTSETYQDCLIIGFDNDGVLIVRSSAMDNKTALWLLMAAVDRVMHPKET